MAGCRMDFGTRKQSRALMEQGLQISLKRYVGWSIWELWVIRPLESRSQVPAFDSVSGATV